MRIVTVVVLLALLAAPALAKEKQSDTANAAPDKSYTLSFSGSLDALSPVYDRIYAADMDPGCGAPSSDSVNDGMAFDLFCIHVENEQPIALILDPGTTNIADTVMSIYCDPFDPLDPGANLVAFDDDDGVSTLSAITIEDGVTLVPDHEYWLVISTYGAGMYGDFAIQTSDNVYACGDVPLENSSWGAVKGLFR